MSEPNRDRPSTAQPAPILRVVPVESATDYNWKRLTCADNEAAYCAGWLSLQCARLPGVTAGVVIVPGADGSSPPISTRWPERSAGPLADLAALADQALAERRVVVEPPEHGLSADANCELRVAVPLGTGQPFAVAAVRATIVPGGRAVQADAIVEQFRWGAGWLEALSQKRQLALTSADFARVMTCLDVIAATEGQRRLAGAAMALGNDLAARLPADRVSIGLRRRGGRVKLEAMSHSALFKDRTRIVDAIEAAMEESLDQLATVAYPQLATTKGRVAIAHRALKEASRNPRASVLSAPLLDGQGNPYGVISVERQSHNALADEDLVLLEAINALLGPILYRQVQANRWLAGRAVDGGAALLSDLLGPERLVPKIGAMAAIALVATMATVRAEHRISARSVLEAEVQRAAVAPFDGFIVSAPVRAGDTVKKGDILAVLDDRDLILDQSKWGAERGKLAQRQRDALARHDRASVVVLDAELRQADAQLKLAQEKLARTRIVSPFDGVVVAGDLSQMLGSPVEKGKTLFEIAPLHAFRLMLHVDEHDLRYVALGQKGSVVIAGRPWAPARLELTKITPVTLAEEGRNAFAVEARLLDTGPGLRPGMEGVAKVDVGQRSLIWIWTRSTIEWLRLAAWTYLP